MVQRKVDLVDFEDAEHVFLALESEELFWSALVAEVSPQIDIAELIPSVEFPAIGQDFPLGFTELSLGSRSEDQSYVPSVEVSILSAVPLSNVALPPTSVEDVGLLFNKEHP
jgi:hypothetical protein